MLILFFPIKEVLQGNRNWIIMAAAIFCGSTLYFYYTTNPTSLAGNELLDQQLTILGDLLELILESHPLAAAMLLFMNNFFTMVQMLLLGFLAGLSPLFTLGVNGALLGMILSAGTAENISVAAIIIFGILPHGIFELSAFLICGSLGLKFGYHCIASPLPDRSRLESFRFIWKESISVLPLVVILLLIAALVEIFITPAALRLIL